MSEKINPIDLKDLEIIKEKLENIDDTMNFYLKDDTYYKQSLMEENYLEYEKKLNELSAEIARIQANIESKKDLVANKIQKDKMLNKKFFEEESRLVTLDTIASSYISCDVYSGKEEIWMCNELIPLKQFKSFKMIAEYLKNKYSIKDNDIFCLKQIIF